MRKTNALQMRRSLGKVLRELERTGEPVLVEKNREPAAVLITLHDFRERFADQTAAEERERLAQEILAFRRVARKSRKRAAELVRELRGPLS
ncbi:MAG TPA: type II toxin-antitoxin system prevent-host-death family antitoxin [Polyangiaceae bacterium]|jgi:prevent-host-death family protein